MRWRLVSGCFGLAAAGCFLVAYLNRGFEEGAYFDAAGEDIPSYGPFDDSIFAQFDAWDGYLWLGAGIAFAVAAVAVLLVGLFSRRPSSA